LMGVNQTGISGTGLHPPRSDMLGKKKSWITILEERQQRLADYRNIEVLQSLTISVFAGRIIRLRGQVDLSCFSKLI